MVYILPNQVVRTFLLALVSSPTLLWPPTLCVSLLLAALTLLFQTVTFHLSSFLTIVSPFSHPVFYPLLLRSCPISVCAAVCCVVQPADLFDSGPSGSLPRETSSLFSEGPLVVTPEKRGGQVWRETEISLATTCHLSSTNQPPSLLTCLLTELILKTWSGFSS